jgi:hypothetical protein
MARVPRFVTATEAARITGLSPMMITRRLKNGQLTCYTDPTDLRRRLIAADELADFLVPKESTKRRSAPAT